MDLKKVSKFIGLFDKTDISEFAWEKDGLKIEFKKEEKEALKVSPAKSKKETQKSIAKDDLVEKVSSETEYAIIKSLMVGTFHRSSTTDKPPLVEEGSVIKEGQKICVIEAMKVLKEVTSEISGKIVKILVDNGHAVEYGQSMFLVDSKQTVAIEPQGGKNV